MVAYETGPAPPRAKLGRTHVGHQSAGEIIDEIVIGPLRRSGAEQVVISGLAGETGQDLGVSAPNGDEPGAGAGDHNAHAVVPDGYVPASQAGQFACSQPGPQPGAEHGQCPRASPGRALGAGQGHQLGPLGAGVRREGRRAGERRAQWGPGGAGPRPQHRAVGAPGGTGPSGQAQDGERL